MAVLVFRIFAIAGIFGYLMLYWDRKKNVEIKKQMEEMHTVLKHSPGGALCFEQKEDILSLSFASDGACEIFGLSQEEAKKALTSGYKSFIFEEDLVKELFLTNEIIKKEVYYRIKDSKGKTKWIYDCREKVQEETGTFIYISLSDISYMMALEEEIQLGEIRLRTVIEGAELMYFNYNVEQDSVLLSQGMIDFTGYNRSSLQFKQLFMQRIINPVTNELDREALKPYMENSDENYIAEEEVILADTKKRWVRIKGKVSVDKEGDIREIMGVVVDIHEIKMKQFELEEKTLRDPLTQVYNKGSSEDLIRKKIEENKNGFEQALFIVDIDDFKAVNDNYGHLMGDVVLSELAFKLFTTFRKDDIVGRIGGDEFIVLMSDVDIRYDSIIKEKAKRLLFEIESLSKREGAPNISCSIGIAKYPQDGASYDEVFKKADEALYEIKKSGKSDFRFYKNK